MSGEKNGDNVGPMRIPQPRSGGSPTDELSRLLPSTMAEGINGQQRDGASPPMDQDAWMAQMMGNLWNQAGGQQGGPNGAAPPPPNGMPPQQQMQGGPQGGGYAPRGGGGGNYGGGYNDGGYGGYQGGRGRGGGRGGYRGGGGGGGYRGRGGRGGDFGGSNGADQWNRHALAVVEFKRERLKKFPCPLGIPPGAYVIVDGDRGQDCGLVVQMITNTDKGMDVQTLDGTDLDGGKLRLESGRVLRAATEAEVNILHQEIAQLERAALKTCRAKCKELGFNFELIDCEYQFDRKKISFFFNSVESIDFRELVKDLYKTFGARIWMENINPEVKNTVPAGALSRHEKVALSKAYPGAPGGDSATGTSVEAQPFYPDAGPSTRRR